jgi:hypothetical protein
LFELLSIRHLYVFLVTSSFAASASFAFSRASFLESEQNHGQFWI